MLKGLKLHAALAAAAMIVAMTSAEAARATEGSVQLVKRTGPEFDRYTNSSDPATRAWIRSKMSRMLVFAPYFDNKTSWYGEGWLYWDLYAVYRDAQTAVEHPEWILRDGAGRKLYIPWGCGGGTCPQYAADITNAGFRRHFIDAAKAAVARGYRGLWLDDVNLEFRVSDGEGREVAPIDPRTGVTMTWAGWRDAVADFVEEVRAALPASVEIVHNSIWYAGPGRDADPHVRRQIAAADVINLERGVNDGGLTGGDGDWSLNAFLAFVDRVHGMGKSVVFDAYDGTPHGREYSLASYFLISNGRDRVGESHAAPDDWWSGWDVDLGAAKGRRTTWNGLMRRDFADGIVLVNEPGAPARTVTLPMAMRTVDGRSVTTVTLAGTRGAVLLGPPPVAGPGAEAPAPGPGGAQPDDAPPAPGTTGPAPGGSSAGDAPAALAPGTSPGTGSSGRPGTRPAGERRVRRPGARVKRRGRVVLVRGRSQRAAGEQARLALQRRDGGEWRVVRRRTVAIRRDGRFAARFAPVRPGRYRAMASVRAG